MKKKKIVLSGLISLNIILLFAVFYIGYIKTPFFLNVGNKLGICSLPKNKRSDYWCINGWTNCLKKLNLANQIVFFGNSITRGSNFHESFPDKDICNLGYSGNTLDDLISRIEMVKAVHPEKIFIMGGINGLRITPIDVFKEKYEALINNIHDSIPDAKIYVQSILPINPKMHAGKKLGKINDKIISCNAIIKNIANTHGLTYIDLYNHYAEDGMLPENITIDGIHLKPESYSLWAALIKPYIYE